MQSDVVRQCQRAAGVVCFGQLGTKSTASAWTRTPCAPTLYGPKSATWAMSSRQRPCALTESLAPKCTERVRCALNECAACVIRWLCRATAMRCCWAQASTALLIGNLRAHRCWARASTGSKLTTVVTMMDRGVPRDWRVRLVRRAVTRTMHVCLRSGVLAASSRE